MEAMEPYFRYISFYLWFIELFFWMHFWATRVCYPWRVESSTSGLSPNQVEDDSSLRLPLPETLRSFLFSIGWYYLFVCNYHGAIFMCAIGWFFSGNCIFPEYDFLGSFRHFSFGTNSFYVAHHRNFQGLYSLILVFRDYWFLVNINHQTKYVFCFTN